MSVIEERKTISISANAVAAAGGSLNTNVILYTKPDFIPDEVILKYITIAAATGTTTVAAPTQFQLVSSDLPDLILFGFNDIFGSVNAAAGNTPGSITITPDIHFKWGKPVNGTFNLQLQLANATANTAITGPSILATTFTGTIFIILDFVKYKKED